MTVGVSGGEDMNTESLREQRKTVTCVSPNAILRNGIGVSVFVLSKLVHLSWKPEKVEDFECHPLERDREQVVSIRNTV